MVTVNQITPITFPDLPNNTALTGNEYLAISQLNASAKVALSSLPAGFSAGVVVYGNTGGAPFPNYRTLTAGNNITIVDAGAQGGLTISAADDIGTVSWGNIEGTLSNQTDLQSALDAKLNSSDNLSDVSNANAALNNLLPSQSGNSGKFLKTDGTDASWSTDTDTGITQLTGDVTAGPGSGSQAATLATVNSNVGTFTTATITVNSKGLITAASSGTAPVTSVSGTSNRITSSGGATPTIDISASYVGQSSITTLGTVATGVWSATTISAARGGTGVANNAASTLTISGAFPTTITVSGTTSVTLPTTGTLVNTAVTTLSSLASVGTITTGVWNAGAVTSSGAVTGTGFIPSSSSIPTNGIYLPASNTPGIAARSLVAATFTNPVSSVNYFSFTGAISGNYPILAVTGSSTNVGLTFGTKGTGPYQFYTNNEGTSAQQFGITHTASAVNYLTATGGASGISPILSADGAGSNLDINITPKGTGITNLNANGGISLKAKTYTGSGTPVNYVQVSNAGTGFPSVVESIGSDTSVSFVYCAQSSGGHIFNTNGPRQGFADVTQCTIDHTASANRYVRITGSNGGAPSITTSGGNLSLQSSSGLIQFGSAGSVTANGTATVTVTNVGPAGITTATIKKWLTIVDSTGTTLYIPAWGA